MRAQPREANNPSNHADSATGNPSSDRLASHSRALEPLEGDAQHPIGLPIQSARGAVLSSAGCAHRHRRWLVGGVLPDMHRVLAAQTVGQRTAATRSAGFSCSDAGRSGDCISGDPLLSASARQWHQPDQVCALHLRRLHIPALTVIGKFITSALAIGSGQSLGPEDPSLQIGAGLASLLGRSLKLSREKLRLIAPVGAAAGSGGSLQLHPLPRYSSLSKR